MENQKSFVFSKKPVNIDKTFFSKNPKNLEISSRIFFRKLYLHEIPCCILTRIKSLLVLFFVNLCYCNTSDWDGISKFLHSFKLVFSPHISNVIFCFRNAHQSCAKPNHLIQYVLQLLCVFKLIKMSAICSRIFDVRIHCQPF